MNNWCQPAKHQRGERALPASQPRHSPWDEFEYIPEIAGFQGCCEHPCAQVCTLSPSLRQGKAVTIAHLIGQLSINLDEFLPQIASIAPLPFLSTLKMKKDLYFQNFQNKVIWGFSGTSAFCCHICFFAHNIFSKFNSNVQICLFISQPALYQ